VKYHINYNIAAQKQLDNLEWRDYMVVYKRLIKLEGNPRPNNSLQLKASKLHRLRIGKFRVIYSVDDKEKLVEVVRVSRRNEDTYKGL
jgi:mRNA interferase RelE/StbE